MRCPGPLVSKKHKSQRKVKFSSKNKYRPIFEKIIQEKKANRELAVAKDMSGKKKRRQNVIYSSSDESLAEEGEILNAGEVSSINDSELSELSSLSPCNEEQEVGDTRKNEFASNPDPDHDYSHSGNEEQDKNKVSKKNPDVKLTVENPHVIKKFQTMQNLQISQITIEDVSTGQCDMSEEVNEAGLKKEIHVFVGVEPTDDDSIFKVNKCNFKPAVVLINDKDLKILQYDKEAKFIIGQPVPEKDEEQKPTCKVLPNISRNENANKHIQLENLKEDLKKMIKAKELIDISIRVRICKLRSQIIDLEDEIEEEMNDLRWQQRRLYVQGLERRISEGDSDSVFEPVSSGTQSKNIDPSSPWTKQEEEQNRIIDQSQPSTSATTLKSEEHMFKGLSETESSTTNSEDLLPGKYSFFD